MEEVQILYRVQARLMKRGESGAESEVTVFKIEDYDSDQEFCLAIANEMLDQISEDRDYTTTKGGDI